MVAMMLTIEVASTIQTASFGIPDTLFLMLLALVVFGPRRLPEIGRQIGKLMYEFRKVSNDFKFQMEEELRASEDAARVQKMQATAAAAAPQAALGIPPAPVLELTSEAATSEVPLERPTEQLVEHSTEQSTEHSTAQPTLIEGTKFVSPADISPEETEQITGEERRAPRIQPPSTGEPVAGRRPFRTVEVAAEPGAEATAAESVSESGSESGHAQDVRVIAADEGRTGREVQPGVPVNSANTGHETPGNTSGPEREASHV